MQRKNRCIDSSDKLNCEMHFVKKAKKWTEMEEIGEKTIRDISIHKMKHRSGEKINTLTCQIN